jgi:DNA-binding XRE family transcriptional regulator
MDAERAQTYLRMFAEAELRRVVAQPPPGPLGYRDAEQDPVGRLTQVVRALRAVDAIDAELADQIYAEFEFAVSVRGPHTRMDPMRSPLIRRRVSLLLRPATGSGTTSVAVRLPATGPVQAPVPPRVIPVGAMIPVHEGDLHGELYLLSFAQTQAGAAFAMVGRMRGWPGLSRRQLGAQAARPAAGRVRRADRRVHAVAGIRAQRHAGGGRAARRRRAGRARLGAFGPGSALTLACYCQGVVASGPGAGGMLPRWRRPELIQLGRELAAGRQAAGLTQAELGRKAGYSRSTVSTVESGGQQVHRGFWETCDRVLGTGGALSRRFDEILLARGAAARAAGPGMAAGTGPEGPGAYARFGWRAEKRGGRLELRTGGAIDALEVSRAAGLLAVQWWLGSAPGAPDIALPPAASALAVIAAGARFYFLAQSGACPWLADDPVPAPAAQDPAGLIRWHAEGSWIPAPDGGGHVAWLYFSGARFRAPSPLALLDLLARAAAAVRSQPGALTLHDGILAVPAWGQAP